MGWPNYVKLSITDRCGAACTTCLQHRVRPRQTMSPERFAEVLEMLAPYPGPLLINGTGDYLWLENNQAYSDVLRDFLAAHPRFTAVTTNAGFSNRPRIWCSVIVCSLNAVDAESFAEHVRCPVGFDRVVENIRYLIAEHEHVEIHSLRHPGNPDPAARLLELFGGTRARIRISEKVENQMRTDVPEPRVYCDYLDALIVAADGTIRTCSHDFFGATILGTVEDIPAALAAKRGLQEAHREGRFEGICQRCNYNVASPGAIYYIRQLGQPA